MNQQYLKWRTCSILNRIKFSSISIALFVFIIQSGPAKAEKCDGQTNYEKCLQMTTTAKNGLRMRESDSIRSKEIASLPYNTTVYLDFFTAAWMNLSGTDGYWVKVCWKEKSISGYVFSGFLKKKKVDGFRFAGMYRMISSGSFAEGEEAEIHIGDTACPNNLKQTAGNLEFSLTLPPAYEVHFNLAGADKKIALGNESCSKNCYRLIIKISKLNVKKAEEGQTVEVGGRVMSIQSIDVKQCDSAAE